MFIVFLFVPNLFLISYSIYKWKEPGYKSPFTYLLALALLFYLIKLYGVYFLTPEVTYIMESDTDIIFTLIPMTIVISFFTVYFIEHNRNVTEQLTESSIELKQTLHKVKKASETDSLTGLANRVKLNRVIQFQYQYYHQLRIPFSIAMIDVDDFKEINDEHGHLVGDAVLQCIAEEFRTIFRKSDIIGRWGGDEFMIIFPNTEAEHFDVIKQNIKKAFDHKTCPEYKKPISLSIGFARVTEHTSLEELIHTADRAMYQHKERD